MRFVVIHLETVLAGQKGEQRQSCILILGLLGIKFDDKVLGRGVLKSMLRILHKEEMWGILSAGNQPVTREGGVKGYISKSNLFRQKRGMMQLSKGSFHRRINNQHGEQ